jgi:hypothetical protein
MTSVDSFFRGVDIISMNKLVQKAKENGKAKDYIVNRLKNHGCAKGRKNCSICMRGSKGTSLNKSKGMKKHPTTYLYDIDD